MPQLNQVDRSIFRRMLRRVCTVCFAPIGLAPRPLSGETTRWMESEFANVEYVPAFVGGKLGDHRLMASVPPKGISLNGLGQRDARAHGSTASLSIGALW